MADYELIHDRISKGRGKAAQRVGQLFTVTRYDFDGFKIVTPAFNCLLRRMTGGPHIEQHFFISQIFELVCDVRDLKVGDILTETHDTPLVQPIINRVVEDKDTTISVVGKVTQSFTPSYMLAQFRPVHKFIGIRLESMCQVRRPKSPTPDGDAGYQEGGENAEFVLSYIPGLNKFEFVDVNIKQDVIYQVPVLVPFQLELAVVRSGKPPFDLPMDWIEGKWRFACPAGWSGFLLRENDHIMHPEGYRLRVHMVQESFIGPQLQQGLADKLES